MFFTIRYRATKRQSYNIFTLRVITVENNSRGGDERNTIKSFVRLEKSGTIPKGLRKTRVFMAYIRVNEIFFTVTFQNMVKLV